MTMIFSDTFDGLGTNPLNGRHVETYWDAGFTNVWWRETTTPWGVPPAFTPLTGALSTLGGEVRQTSGNGNACWVSNWQSPVESVVDFTMTIDVVAGDGSGDVVCAGYYSDDIHNFDLGVQLAGGGAGVTLSVHRYGTVYASVVAGAGANRIHITRGPDTSGPSYQRRARVYVNETLVYTSEFNFFGGNPCIAASGNSSVRAIVYHQGVLPPAPPEPAARWWRNEKNAALE